MTFKLGKRSRDELRGVHKDLVAVVELAITLTHVDFVVLDGLRTQKEQDELVKSGASKTRDSRHLTGHAVDLGAIVGGKIRWDWNLYAMIAKAMSEAAKRLNVPLEWGGVWKSFPDGGHFQLPKRSYP